MFYNFYDVTQEEVKAVNSVLSKDIEKLRKDRSEGSGLKPEPIKIKPELPNDSISVDLK